MITKRMGETGEQFRARVEAGIEERELPQGTVLHLNGVPVSVVGVAVVETNQENWTLIDAPPVETEQADEKPAPKKSGKK